MNEQLPAIVIIEDEKDIRRFVRGALEEEGCRVQEAQTVSEGRRLFETSTPALVILDLGLPDGDGVDFIRELRAWSAVPVMVLSARSSESEKIDALDVGADDYLTKPFGVGELLARVRAVLRRKPTHSKEATPIAEFGDIRVDFTRRRVERGGQPLHLTPIEFRLMAVLVANANKVLTHRQLLKEVWGPSHVDSSHYLRIYVGHLRQKLEADSTRPRYILTETGIGYRLCTDPHP